MTGRSGPGSIDRWIDHWSRHRPDHPAVVIDDTSVSYRELSDRFLRLVAWLTDRGVGPGDRIAYCGLNGLGVLDTLAACAHLGAVFLPLNNRLSTAELAFQLADAEPILVLAADGFAPTLEAAAGPERTVVDVDALGFDDGFGEGVPVGVDGNEPDRPTSGPGRGRSADDPLLMVYTSGTTGEPKGAVHTRGSILFTVLNGVAHQDLTAADRLLTVLPLFHVGGLNIQTLPALYVGATVILQRRFDPGHALELVSRHRPTQTLLVPAVMSAILDHPQFDRTDLSSLIGINSGSSVVPDHLIRGFLDRGIPVGQVYGMSETGPTAVVLRYADGAAHLGSCGRPALHSELRLVDDAGVDAAPGDAGEVLVRGPHLFDHYHGRPAQTEAAFIDGWFRTGDIGRLDGQGWLFIEDRLGDVLISGGENVYPAEVENTLAQHPGIGAVAVIGRPDPQWGEVPVAVIEPSADAPTPDVAELRTWCVDRLARFKQPREVIVVDQLPRTALGKVTKHVLRAGLSG